MQALSAAGSRTVPRPPRLKLEGRSPAIAGRAVVGTSPVLISNHGDGSDRAHAKRTHPMRVDAGSIEELRDRGLFQTAEAPSLLLILALELLVRASEAAAATADFRSARTVGSRGASWFLSQEQVPRYRGSGPFQRAG